MAHRLIVRHGDGGRFVNGMIKVSYEIVMSRIRRSRRKDIFRGEHIGYSKYIYSAPFFDGIGAGFVGRVPVLPTVSTG